MDLYATTLPLVRPYIPHATEPVLKQAIRWAMDDFARSTESLREDVTITSVADQASYDLGQTANTEVIRVAKFRNTNEQGPDLHRQSYEVTEDGNIVFDTAPVVSGDVYWAELVLLPLDAIAGSYPTAHGTRWARGIAAGAIYHLKSQQDQPWGAPDGALHGYHDRYRTWISRAKKEKISERKTGDLRIIPRRFV